MSQPFAVAQVFTGYEGKLVPLKDTIRSFKEILSGQHDSVPESAFYMVCFVCTQDIGGLLACTTGRYHRGCQVQGGAARQGYGWFLDGWRGIENVPPFFTLFHGRCSTNRLKNEFAIEDGVYLENV